VFTFRRQRADEPSPIYELRRAEAEDAYYERERGDDAQAAKRERARTRAR
jgi:hypothetical protein